MRRRRLYPILPTIGVAALLALALVATPAASARRHMAGVSTSGNVSLSASTYTVSEDAGYATITIVRSGDADALYGEEEVRYGVKQQDAINGVDFDVVPNTLATFEPGQTTFTFRVRIIDRGMADAPAVHAKVYLFGASPQPLGSVSTADLTILRDDPLETRNPANPLSFGSPYYLAPGHLWRPAVRDQVVSARLGQRAGQGRQADPPEAPKAGRGARCDRQRADRISILLLQHPAQHGRSRVPLSAADPAQGAQHHGSADDLFARRQGREDGDSRVRTQL